MTAAARMTQTIEARVDPEHPAQLHSRRVSSRIETIRTASSATEGHGPGVEAGPPSMADESVPWRFLRATSKTSAPVLGQVEPMAG